MKPGTPIRWRCYKARGRPGSRFVERSSRRIPWCGDGQVGKEDQSSLLAERAPGDINAGELEHQLVN